VERRQLAKADRLDVAPEAGNRRISDEGQRHARRDDWSRHRRQDFAVDARLREHRDRNAPSAKTAADVVVLRMKSVGSNEFTMDISCLLSITNM
jgi:hypothetical protein